jgi:hypothetical protein
VGSGIKVLYMPGSWFGVYGLWWAAAKAKPEFSKSMGESTSMRWGGSEMHRIHIRFTVLGHHAIKTCPTLLGFRVFQVSPYNMISTHSDTCSNLVG